ncbi:MAG: S46 family peptidase [Planctomycetota bacterium]
MRNALRPKASPAGSLSGPFFAVLLASLTSASLAAASSSAPVDEGMWLFNNAPKEQISKRYGFELTPEWLEHVQKSAVRVSTGGSGSIVSAGGLVMTNHHVASGVIEKLSTADNNLLENGFHAVDLEDEIKCPDVHLDVLWSIEDVTEKVEGAAKGLDSAEAGAAKRKAITEIQDAARAATGLEPEVVTLYQGGRYHLYQYRRFNDIRLVFAPEKSIAFYGGDNDNFEYPRFCLDVTFLRIYEDDKPYTPEHFLQWSENGADDGELCFVAGHPGRTQRLNTVAHLEYLRDVSVPDAMRSLMRSEVLLQNFSGKSAEHRRRAEGDLFSVQNSRKVYVGRVAGLLDPEVFEAKRAEEARLRATVEANPEWKAAYGDAWDEIQKARDAARRLRDEYNAVGGPSMSIGSAAQSFAATLVRLTAELEKPSAERLPEFGDAALPSLYQALYSPAPIYTNYEIFSLANGLSNMAESLGADHPLVVAALAGKSPQARAEECILGSKLADIDVRRSMAEGGAKALAASGDPLVELCLALDGAARRVRKGFEDEVGSVEAQAYGKIAAARFAVFGDSVYPDATFTLRLSYGAIRGYQEGEVQVPPFTAFGGVFDKAKERAGEEWYELPESWLEAADSIDASTPFNFVSTHDIIGGNSGSPVIDSEGAVVGLIFDGNIQSLIGNYAYSDKVARSVSVDSRGIIGALDQVYKAERIVAELRAGSK